MTMRRVCELFREAGVPAGVFQTVNGTKDAVEALCDHEDVKCVTFVGTTRVAESLAQRCRAKNKRVLALGGAKNHLISAPDRDLEMAASDIAASFTGCAGQRCMAASVLLTVGKQDDLVDLIAKKAATLTPGQGNGQMGPVIDKASRDRIVSYIDEAEKGGAKIVLDGRPWVRERNEKLTQDVLKQGWWVGPTVILHTNRADPALHDEIFGPVISILQVDNKDQCIEIQNASPYGNAASIYTQSGAVADWFTKRFHSGMLGVNIGVPVPREPFSFGGSERSKFGDFDITGDGGIELFTIRKKITTKWALPTEKNWMN
jgi:malonate-semialdehyde dehydrogenase (acetylating)/methylmalonate-semialdehyde dehydrogenase